jgi:site-specific DNA recombinase
VTTTAKRLDGYVRVSRTNGREGDSYISPTVQREKIEQWAALHDVELGEVVVEEDVSGVKRLDDRQLGRLVRRCEEGESEGIVVYRLDRFSRSPRDTFEALDRLEKAGSRLVGVADGVDSSAPSGELVVGVLAGIAREQWKQRRDNWAEATGRAVADGVHVSSRPPTGYVRGGRRSRLEPDPDVAPLVR